MAIRVAIVGTGPAGFYAAESLVKSGLALRVDLIERLPTPFGLVRSGVAPDHQKTKRIERAFARTTEHPDVHFYGNVGLGEDLTLDELRGLYDAVVLAVGAPSDRRLAIPGEDKKNVFGSTAFVGWYNGHPDYAGLDPDLNITDAAVVGNGNVALDVARVLVKTREEMAHSDMPRDILQRIQHSPLRDVHVLGRRGPAQSKFSNPELAEIVRLADAVPSVEPPELPEEPEEEQDDRTRRRVAKNLAIFRQFLERKPAGERRRVRFRFWARPVEILGEKTVSGVKVAETALDRDGRLIDTGRTEIIPCGLLVSAIGYTAPTLEELPFDRRGGHFRHDDGRIDKGLYCVGWCRRGPTGTIGTNKADGDAIVAHIASEIADSGKHGGEGLERLLEGRGVRWIDAEDWAKIDAAERAAAPEGAPRRKFVRVKDMLALLERDSRASGSG